MTRIGFTLSVLLISFAATAAETASYPRTLTGEEIQVHFGLNPSLIINPDHETFTLKSQLDGKISRDCLKCKVGTDQGRMQFKPHEGLVCLNWNKASYPVPGCYQVIQTAENKFLLKGQDGKMELPYSAMVDATDPLKKELVNSLQVDLSRYRPSSEQLREAAKKALTQRGWQRDAVADEPTRLVGRLEKGGRIYRVVIRLGNARADMGYLAGFEAKGQDWLRNLERDMIAALTTTWK